MKKRNMYLKFNSNFEPEPINCSFMDEFLNVYKKVIQNNNKKGKFIKIRADLNKNIDYRLIIHY